MNRSEPVFYIICIKNDSIYHRIRFRFEFQFRRAAALLQPIRVFASQAEGWVFELRPQQPLVGKTDSGSATSKRLATSVTVG